eukprot:14043389-Alexandrium_andersonii.AAC.1
MEQRKHVADVHVGVWAQRIILSFQKVPSEGPSQGEVSGALSRARRASEHRLEASGVSGLYLYMNIVCPPSHPGVRP